MAQMVEAGVHENPLEPGVEAREVPERRPAGPGLGDRFLRGVLGLVSIAQDQCRGAVALQQAGVVERGESLEALRAPRLDRGRWLIVEPVVAPPHRGQPCLHCNFPTPAPFGPALQLYDTPAAENVPGAS